MSDLAVEALRLNKESIDHRYGQGKSAESYVDAGFQWTVRWLLQPREIFHQVADLGEGEGFFHGRHGGDRF